MKALFIVFLVLFTKKGMAGEERMTAAEFFNQANFENMEVICREFYHEDILFEDPLGKIQGLEKLIAYYKNMYENVLSIKFETVNNFEKGEESTFVWRMLLEHKKVGDGELIELGGVSLLRYKGSKVIFHRDYFDLGAMLYERIPVLGRLIKWVKEKAHGG